MARKLILACVTTLALAGPARADDGDDAIRDAASKVQSAWGSLSSMGDFHSAAGYMQTAIMGLKYVCDLYVAELNDRRDFLSRNTRAEDDGYALATGALNKLDAFASEGQRTALSALKN